MVNGVNLGATAVWPSIRIHSANKLPQSHKLSQPENPSASKGVTMSLHERELFSTEIQLPCGRKMSASVAKPANFSADNPFLIVRGVDFDGTSFTKAVNINEVNPRDATLVEMLALDGYHMLKGIRDSAHPFISALLHLGKDTSNLSAFFRFDFISTLEAYHKSHTLNIEPDSDVLKPLQSIIDALIRHAERRYHLALRTRTKLAYLPQDLQSYKLAARISILWWLGYTFKEVNCHGKR